MGYTLFARGEPKFELVRLRSRSDLMYVIDKSLAERDQTELQIHGFRGYKWFTDTGGMVEPSPLHR